MALRISLRLQPVGSQQAGTRVTAVVNTGFETDRPELLLPAACAQALELYPSPPPGARAERYETAGGSATFWRIPEAVRVAIDAEGVGAPPGLEADVLVSEVDREVLLNDVLAGDLGIVILNARRGDWRLSGDPPDRVRPSLGRQLW